ncbi:MAG: acyl-CoA dehydrogenase, partial [Jatrophihabitans sp.]
TKGGLAGVDNGTLMFDHVRVSRRMLLNRYGGVSDQGVYESPIDNPDRRFFTMLGTLVRGRISIAAGGGVVARKALSIATRYAVARRQFSAPGHDGEVLLIDYLAHQRKLLPAIATSYAMMFAQNELTERLQELHEAPEKDQEAQRELETRAAGMKAMSTRFGNDTAQMCREACGGAGYMAENGLTVLRQDADVFATFEGDNTVLLQLVAKELLTGYRDHFGELDIVGTALFIGEQVVDTVVERAGGRRLLQRLRDVTPSSGEDGGIHDRDWHIEMFDYRQKHLLETLARRLRKAAGAEDPFTVFNAAQDHLLTAARAHIDGVLLAAFVHGIESMPEGPERELLISLCDLFALSTIEAERGWFQEHGLLTGARSKSVIAAVNEICAAIRPHARVLVDGFGVPDSAISAPIAWPADVPEASGRPEG